MKWNGLVDIHTLKLDTHLETTFSKALLESAKRGSFTFEIHPDSTQMHQRKKYILRRHGNVDLIWHK